MATTPGMRRLFLKLLPGDEAHFPFCKPKFTDIETSVDFTAVEDETNVRLSKYKKVLSIGCLIDSDNEDDIKVVKAWTAQYASLRKWPTTALQRDNVIKAVSEVRAFHAPAVDNESKVIKLLSNRQFVVL